MHQRRIVSRFSTLPIPSGFARNAAQLPVLVAHGEADPIVRVEHLRRMVARFEDLGQPIEYEEYPGVGHVSWHNTYKDGRIFDWFTQHVRDPHLREVNLLTTDPARYGTSYWIQVEGLNKSRVPGRISARVTTGNLITVETRNITRFRLNTAAWQAAENWPHSIRSSISAFP